jgi:hypothetical protein
MDMIETKAPEPPRVDMQAIRRGRPVISSEPLPKTRERIDGFTADGARKLVTVIRDYWEQRGVGVTVWAEQTLLGWPELD